MILVFDTDVLIDILKGKTTTIEQVEKLSEKAELLSCSVITVGEIFAGMKEEEEKATRKLLDGLITWEVSEEIAELGGRLKNKTKSHLLYLDDCLIAASSLNIGAVLVSKNVKHYPFKALKLHRIM